MHDQGFVHARAENQRHHHRIEPQHWCVECHPAIPVAVGPTNIRLNLITRQIDSVYDSEK
jgi:hypothetical protein